MDISGSMESHNKIDEARKAANLFLDKLDPRSDTGLILFDHLLRVKEPPGRDPTQFAAHRVQLRQKVDAARPAAAPPTSTPPPRPCGCSRTLRAAGPWC